LVEIIHNSNNSKKNDTLTWSMVQRLFRFLPLERSAFAGFENFWFSEKQDLYQDEVKLTAES